MGKIYLFKDQDDYVKDLTNDNIINVIGTKGSGKTTTSLNYINDDEYIVINCDNLFKDRHTLEESEELTSIRKMLNDKYGLLNPNDDFTNCYNDIIKYILSKNKKGLIEGNSIQNVEFNSLKGRIVIKRTALFKSFKRAVKRDFKNEYYMNLEKEKHKYLYKLIRLYKITKRRLNVFKHAKDIEKILDKLEKLS